MSPASLCLLCTLIFPLQNESQTAQGTKFTSLNQETDADEKKPESSTDDPQLRMKVESLILKLESDSFLERNNAEKDLIAMGTDILDLIDEIESPGPEASKRIVSIRNALQLVAIKESTEPTTVTLEGEMTIAEAFAAIGKQTGNSIIGVEGVGEGISVSLENAPFWKAMDKVLDDCGLTIDDYGGDGESLQLIPRGVSPDRSGKADYKSIFRISNSRLSLSRNLENPQLDLFRLTVKIAWEPRLQPISIGIPIESLKIRDDVGDEIKLARESGMIGSSIEKQPSIELTLPVQLPSPEASHVNVEGRFEAIVPGRVEDFEFTNLKNIGKEKPEVRHGQATVTLESFGTNKDLHEARLLIHFHKAQDSLESHRGWINGNEAILVEKDGTEIEKIHVDMYRQTEQDVGFRYLFDVQEIPDGMKLIYKSPAAVVPLPIDFQLKRIELP